MSDVFVISPYTDDDYDVRNSRAMQADLYIAALSINGIVAYSTISAMHHLLSITDLPSDWEYWAEHCKKMMMDANEVHVLCLDGWKTSIGVQDEIEIAKVFNKKIIYIKKNGKTKC